MVKKKKKENIGVNLHDVGLAKVFLHNDTKCTNSKRKNRYKLDFIKIKSFVLQKIHQKGEKDNPQNGRKYLKIIYVTRGLFLEHIKNTYNSILKRQFN